MLKLNNLPRFTSPRNDKQPKLDLAGRREDIAYIHGKIILCHLLWNMVQVAVLWLAVPTGRMVLVGCRLRSDNIKYIK